MLTLIDDYKLVMISTFWIFKTWEKYNFFNETKQWKFLGFDRMHENKIFFIFVFVKGN